MYVYVYVYVVLPYLAYTGSLPLRENLVNSGDFEGFWLHSGKTQGNLCVPPGRGGALGLKIDGVVPPGQTGSDPECLCLHLLHSS